MTLGQIEAMDLLESHGAASDAEDGKGRTPAQLLEERNNQHNPGPYFA